MGLSVPASVDWHSYTSSPNSIRFVNRYRDYKRNAALLDFDDLLHHARDLVKDKCAGALSVGKTLPAYSGR